MRAEKTDTHIRQEQIVRAALDQINHYGIKKLSIASVAQGVGVVPSAIYRHFKSKDDVLDAVPDMIEGKLQANIRLTCEETPNPIERLKRLMVRHVQTIRENQAIPRIIFSEDLYGGRQGRKTKVYRIVMRYLDQVAEIVRQGQKEGQIRPDVDPEAVSLFFLGMVQPTGFLWFLSDGKFDLKKHTGKVWQLFAKMIRKE
jgi:AcrR family transcriptional regulator